MITISRVLLIACTFLSFPMHAKENKPIALTSVESKINLNQADLNTLTHSIKGLGKKRAQAMIQYRELHKGFKSLDELAQIKGFGEQFMKHHQDEIQAMFYLPKGQ